MTYDPDAPTPMDEAECHPMFWDRFTRHIQLPQELEDELVTEYEADVAKLMGRLIRALDNETGTRLTKYDVELLFQEIGNGIEGAEARARRHVEESK